MGNPRRTNGHRRDQVRRRVLAEESDCWLCGQPVDKTLGIMPGVHSPRCAKPDCTGCVPHPKSPTVDEIIPVAHGGSPFDRRNCRLACRDCNIKRGDGTKKAKPKVAPLITQRKW